LVWVKCASPILSLGLEEALKAHAAHVHRGQKPPAGDSASLAVLFCSRAEDVAWELKHLQALAPNTPSVLFSFSVDPQQARSALRAGARGFIHAEMTPEQIVRTLSVASEGDVVLPRELLNHFVKEQSQQQGDLPGLTSRQWEILRLVAEGESNAQIAHQLLLSESTIKQHLRRAYKTLGINNRTQAAQLFRLNNSVRTNRGLMQRQPSEPQSKRTQTEREPKMRRVLLVEPHQTLREALASVLEKESDLAVVAQTGSIAEYRSTDLAGIDVALVETQLSNANGTELIREIGSHGIPVVVMTLTPSSSVRSQALEAGAKEVLGKDASVEKLCEAMRRAASNGQVRSPGAKESTSDGF
jgi:DNA-binding NarL/FixJ family response regulator